MTNLPEEYPNGDQDTLIESEVVYMGDREFTISSLGWKYAQVWVKEFLTTVAPYMNILRDWDNKSIEKIDLASDEGQARALELGTLLLQKAPDQIFELVALHTAFKEDREFIEENASKLQVINAFKVIMSQEFPLGKLIALFGPLYQQISKRQQKRSGELTEIVPITKQQ